MDSKETSSHRSSNSNSPSGIPLEGSAASPSVNGKKRPREEESTDVQEQQQQQSATQLASQADVPAVNNGNGESPHSKSPKITEGVSGESSRQGQQDAAAAATPKGTTTPPYAGKDKKGVTGKEKRGTEDLLTPLAAFDWTAFLSKCEAELKGVEGEEVALLDEYHSWEWLHELWSTCRSQSENLRLSREVATIAKWTQLKEAEVEDARVKHTEDMQKISSVLGIVSSFSPSPGK